MRRDERFFAKVRDLGDCWHWVASTTTNGYGCFWDGERNRPAHRWAWEFFNGPIPDGLVLDHLCRNILCVNPDHLEPVTHTVNMRRGVFPVVGSCKWGHEFSEANTYVTKAGKRHCRACNARRTRLRGRAVRNPDRVRVGVAVA